MTMVVRSGPVSFALLAATFLVATVQPLLAQEPARQDGPSTTSRIQKRTYRFEEAGEDTEYALFVPSRYRKALKFPLIVALHGLGSNPQQILRYRGLTRLAEAHGYIVVAPMGYNRRGWYGSRGPTSPRSEPQNLGELSEKDVMNVLAIVRREFNVDEDRIYLMGHSMGGAGAWHLGGKYPEIWAGLAPIAPAVRGEPKGLEKIKHVPVIVVHGDKDELIPVARTRRWVARLKELGIEHEYLEIAGGGHVRVAFESLPRVFEFFNDHRKTPRIVGTKVKSPSKPTLAIEGHLLARDGDSIKVRGPDKVWTVTWSLQTRFGVAPVLWNGLLSGRITERILISDKSGGNNDQVVEFDLPERLFLECRLSSPAEVKAARDEGKASSRVFDLYARGIEPRLPTRADPRLVGRLLPGPAPGKPPYRLEVDDRVLEFQWIGRPYIKVFDVITPRDLEPFINDVWVQGVMRDGRLAANRIAITPVGDALNGEDPKLPRYLFLGDSISFGYNAALRQALKGKVNLHHPPVNCGSSGGGARSIHRWLGAYDVPGRRWDVISFNFGHWDAGNTRERYQDNLERIIAKLKKTKAKLVWVTTCPVPHGYPEEDGLGSGDKAPGRKAGVMKKYLNPWALEVMQRHPEILICDHWQIVKDGEGDLYKEWWLGRNVHFSGKLNQPLAEALARTVVTGLGGGSESTNDR